MIKYLLLTVLTFSCFSGEINEDLDRALNMKDTQAVIKIIHKGHHLIAKRDTGEKALRFCAAKGLLEPLKLLVESDCKLEETGKDDLFDGFTALNLALKYNHSECAVYLIQNGANPNIKVRAEGEKGRTSLMYALEHSNMMLVKHLIKAGAEINSRDKQGMTPLSTACMEGSLELARIIVDGGAKLSSRDHNKWNALFYAVRGNNPEIVKLLLHKGLKADKVDRDMMTPLDYISIYIGDYRKQNPEKLNKALKIKEILNSYEEGK